MTPTLPPERYALFLGVRRGLPLAASLAAFALALADHAHRGWWLLAAVSALTLVWTTFQRGEAYLRARPGFVRWDARWVKAFRPLARRVGMEDAWILSF
ncbi:MAG TPA: hypothetical protein VJ570_00820, partial [Holophagaceae bacterium]|nr:hypothetical protein [Holophagaceae bacterium]